MRRCFGLLICLLLLGACAYMDNSQPRNAIPLEAGAYRASYGLASSNNIYSMGRFEPDALNQVIQDRDSYEYGTQTPVLWDVGVGKGCALGFQGGIFLSSGFKGREFDQQYPSISTSFHLKMNAQKFFDLGSNTYFAVFPGAGIASGTETIVFSHRMRYDRVSIELPVTISKLYELSPKIDLVASFSARSARDWVHSDINGPGEGSWSYIDYLNQPLNKFQRNALIGHIDIQIQKHWKITLQYGAEHSSGESATKWSPVFYIGMGPESIRKF